MGSYSDAVNNISSKSQEKAHYRECGAYGCCLKVPLIPGADNVCSYHRDRNQYYPNTDIQALTKSIKENRRWITGYKKMVNWETTDWGKYSNQLQYQEFCPMREGELPSPYMARFYSELSDKIFSEAV